MEAKKKDVAFCRPSNLPLWMLCIKNVAGFDQSLPFLSLHGVFHLSKQFPTKAIFNVINILASSLFLNMYVYVQISRGLCACSKCFTSLPLQERSHDSSFLIVPEPTISFSPGLYFVYFVHTFLQKTTLSESIA